MSSSFLPPNTAEFGEVELVADPVPILFSGDGFAPYRKWVAAIVTAVALVLWAALNDNVVTWAEIVAIGIAAANVVAIERIPNASEGVAKFAKFIAAAVSAVLVAVSQVAFDGALTSQETLFILLAALGALGVFQAPNETSGVLRMTSKE